MPIVGAPGVLALIEKVAEVDVAEKDALPLWVAMMVQVPVATIVTLPLATVQTNGVCVLNVIGNMDDATAVTGINVELKN